MEIIDVEKLFVFGGAYGNLEATKSVLAEANKRGYSNNEVLFTGDSVAYCSKPEETAKLIQSAGIHALKGNCEAALSSDSDECGCGFEDGTECDILSNQWYQFCKKNISSDTISWMAELPFSLIFQFGTVRFLAVHATPKTDNKFVFASSLSSKALDGLVNKFDGFIVGHSGIPFIGQIGKAVWLNSGASGMPANDGTSRVWYATIEMSSNSLLFQTHALEYDFATAAIDMQRNGLANGYMDCLTTGIWPSHDVLPSVENSKTGLVLQSETYATTI